MAHVIVDMQLSLLREKFEVTELVMVDGGKRISTELATIHEKLRNFIGGLLSKETKTFNQQVQTAMDNGNADAKFELRKQVCVVVEEGWFRQALCGDLRIEFAEAEPDLLCI